MPDGSNECFNRPFLDSNHGLAVLIQAIHLVLGISSGGDGWDSGCAGLLADESGFGFECFEHVIGVVSASEFDGIDGIDGIGGGFNKLGHSIFVIEQVEKGAELAGDVCNVFDGGIMLVLASFIFHKVDFVDAFQSHHLVCVTGSVGCITHIAWYENCRQL